MSVPARPAQPALTLWGMLSGFPHLFRHNIQGHFNAFLSCLVPSHARNYNFVLQRVKTYKVWGVWVLPLFDFNQTISTVALVLPSAKYFVPPLWCQEISLFLLIQVSRDTFLGLAVPVTQVHITLFMFYYVLRFLLTFLLNFFYTDNSNQFDLYSIISYQQTHQSAFCCKLKTPQ